MSVKTSDEKIAQIKAMRLKGYSQAFICNAVEVSIFVVQQACKDIKIDLRFGKKKIDCKDSFPVKKLKFSDLSEADQKRYNECRPPSKNEDKETFITGKKGEYGKAVVFEDYRANFGG
jgi:hypothetical protein